MNGQYKVSREFVEYILKTGKYDEDAYQLVCKGYNGHEDEYTELYADDWTGISGEVELADHWHSYELWEKEAIKGADRSPNAVLDEICLNVPTQEKMEALFNIINKTCTEFEQTIIGQILLGRLIELHGVEQVLEMVESIDEAMVEADEEEKLTHDGWDEVIH